MFSAQAKPTKSEVSLSSDDDKVDNSSQRLGLMKSKVEGRVKVREKL